MICPSPKVFGFAVCLTATALSAEAAARVCTWSSAHNSNARPSGNWTCSQGSGPPDTGDTVRFTGASSNRDCGLSGGSYASLSIDSSYTGTVSVSGAMTLTGALSVAGGTLDAGSGTLNVGSISVTGGSLILPSGATQVSGDIVANGGTFDGHGGSVTLTGTSASGTIRSGGSSFGALTINGTGGTYTVQDALATTGALTLTAGTLVTGSQAVRVGGSVAVQSGATLTMASGSSLSVGTALAMNGTLNVTNGTIQRVSGRYAFLVGSTASATPTLNINGLTVDGTDANGMWINADHGAKTTVTRFDNLTFRNGTGTQLLQIYASSLNLRSNGCTFDGSTTYAVKLTGNGSGDGPHALFGNASCATNDATTHVCANSEKLDDDANNDGAPDHPTTNGAVVQFIHAAPSDTAGVLVGYPTAAFDWNSFTYYSTYVTFHDASNGSDVIYVRDESGNALYSWTDPSTDETIVGTPQWNTVNNVHYLYVAVNGGTSNTGKVYRLTDTGTGDTSGSLTLDTSWGTSGAYACGCTMKSNLSLDTTNVYWAATTSTAQVLMGITQSNGAKISTSWPVTTPADVTTSAPTLVTKSGATTLYLGVTKSLLQLAVTGTTFLQNTKPGTITGRVTTGTSFASGTSGTSRVYAGDSNGAMWGISPTNFAGNNAIWTYAAGAAITNNTYDASTDTVQFGTAGGNLVVLNAGTGTVLNSAYPLTLDASDPITAAPLYVSGVLVVGTTKGKVYFIDRNTGTGASIIKTISFGSTQSVSTVSYDPDTARVMVATSSAANDGRLNYFDMVSDPTPSSL